MEERSLLLETYEEEIKNAIEKTLPEAWSILSDQGR